MKHEFSVFVFAAKSRGIAIPVDLDSQVNSLFERSQIIIRSTNRWLSVRQNRRESSPATSRDYRTIIEGLQVSNEIDFHDMFPFVWMSLGFTGGFLPALWPMAN